MQLTDLDFSRKYPTSAGGFSVRRDKKVDGVSLSSLYYRVKNQSNISDTQRRFALDSLEKLLFNTGVVWPSMTLTKQIVSYCLNLVGDDDLRYQN